MQAYLYIFAAAILYISGDFLAKLWGIKNDWKVLAGCLLVYLVAGFCFAFAIKKSSLSLAVGLMPLTTVIAGITFGYFYFGEKLTHFQYFGLVLGILALVFLLIPFENFVK